MYLIGGIVALSGAGFFLWRSYGRNVSNDGKNYVTKEAYKDWLKQGGQEIEKVKSSKEFGDVVVTLNYIPAEKRALREAGSLNSPVFETALEEARKFFACQLTISHKEGLDILNTQSEIYRDYESRVKYFSFGIQRKLYLTTGSKKVPCALMHFERTFGLGKALTLNLAFESKELATTGESPVLTWEDDFFGIGKINLSIGKNELNALPQIKS